MLNQVYLPQSIPLFGALEMAEHGYQGVLYRFVIDDRIHTLPALLVGDFEPNR